MENLVIEVAGHTNTGKTIVVRNIQRMLRQAGISVIVEGDDDTHDVSLRKSQPEMLDVLGSRDEEFTVKIIERQMNRNSNEN